MKSLKSLSPRRQDAKGAKEFDVFINRRSGLHPRRTMLSPRHALDGTPPSLHALKRKSQRLRCLGYDAKDAKGKKECLTFELSLPLAEPEICYASSIRKKESFFLATLASWRLSERLFRIGRSVA